MRVWHYSWAMNSRPLAALAIGASLFAWGPRMAVAASAADTAGRVDQLLRDDITKSKATDTKSEKSSPAVVKSEISSRARDEIRKPRGDKGLEVGIPGRLFLQAGIARGAGRQAG